MASINSDNVQFSKRYSQTELFGCDRPLLHNTHTEPVRVHCAEHAFMECYLHGAKERTSTDSTKIG